MKLLNKKIKNQNLFKVRFYITKFIFFNNLNLNNNKLEYIFLLKEFFKDYNKFQFISTQYLINNLKQKKFVKFLIRSCFSEFSGFLLYREISLISNPIIFKIFKLLSRDEARHAGYLNKFLYNFNSQVFLNLLTKKKKFFFFQPRLIFYAVYLSEKIGYWRYIILYRHLQKKLEKKNFFKFLESWCFDENRHGDFFSLILRDKEPFIKGSLSRLFSRFFLISVFLTMFINDKINITFYKILYQNYYNFDFQVIEKTNFTASKILPININLLEHKLIKIFKKLILFSTNSKLNLNIFYFKPIFRKKSQFKENYL